MHRNPLRGHDFGRGTNRVRTVAAPREISVRSALASDLGFHQVHSIQGGFTRNEQLSNVEQTCTSAGPLGIMSSVPHE